jgi:hypothetical protein
MNSRKADQICKEVVYQFYSPTSKLSLSAATAMGLKQNAIPIPDEIGK